MAEQPLDYLAATDQLIQSYEGIPAGSFAGVDLMRRQLLHQREKAILARLADAPDAPQAIDVALNTTEAPQGGTELTLLADVLRALQDVIVAVAQSLREQPTQFGPITSEIQDSVRLSVAFALPGSMRLRLVPASPERQQPLFDDGSETLLHHSIASVLELMDRSRTDDTDGLVEQLANVGPRAAGHLASLAAALDTGRATLAVGWRSPDWTYSTLLDRAAAVRLTSVLKRVETRERALVVQGRIVGGSLVRRAFEIETDDGTILSGRVNEEVLQALEELFGQTCTAEISVQETSLPSGETKEVFRLQRLTA